MSNLKVKMTDLEKETVFLFNEKEREAIIDTYNPKLLAQLAKLAEEYPDECYLTREHEMGNKCYHLPKSWFRIKSPMKLTEEQKAERVARLNKNNN